MTQLPDPTPIALPSGNVTTTTATTSTSIPITDRLTTVPTHEGTIPFHHPFLPPSTPCHTWYKIVGSLHPASPNTPSPTPLILLHGGPGACHNYLLNLTVLATHHSHRPLIFYDQLGNGLSTHLPSKRGDTKFWTPELFVAELRNLLRHLGLGSESDTEGTGSGRIRQYDILGQSWGGMLGAMFAAERPMGLRRLIVSNSPASMRLWVESCGVWIRRLPEEVKRGIEEGERKGDWEGEEYREAVMFFYKRHLCRVWPFPPDVQASLDWLAKDDTVYLTMNGPSEFTVIGNLKDWDARPLLHKIDVPTLVLNGELDEARDSCVYPWFEGIQKCRWYTFPGLSHMSNVEDLDAYVRIVEGFLSGRVNE